MRRRRAGGVLAAALAVLLVVPPSAVAQEGAPRPFLPAAPLDQRFVDSMDSVVGLAPADTCLTVLVDGRPAYRHEGATGLVPASTRKLLTATVALDRLGSDTRFTTEVRGARPNAAGVVDGDLHLVGGGDPVLTTNVHRVLHRQGDDVALTSLDELADQVAASGIKGVTGQVLGDDSRYDALRVVPSWPDRYVRQGQVGPLSALVVDRGTDTEVPEDPADRVIERRSTDPPASAAQIFTALLRDRGILVAGEGAAGPAPAGGSVVGRIESPPLQDVVARMLLTSDNQIAELLTKEIGLHDGNGGSTAGGTAAIAARARALGLLDPASRIIDGSGLDPGNRATCDELVRTLRHAGGPDGTLGPDLPVAATSGTLSRRFRGTPAAGKLRAKTGSLNAVASLAGYVELPKGEIATFAFIANGPSPDGKVLGAEELLATLLADHVPPCPSAAARPLVVPLPAAVQLAPIPGAALAAVAVPGATATVRALEAQAADLVGRCLAARARSGVGLLLASPRSGG